MTKIKLIDGTIINAETVELVNGALEITTMESTVEELAAIFSDKTKTNLITLMTESEIESGQQIGFTSFAGIHYDEAGLKTVQLFQPVDVTEARLSAVEGTVSQAMAVVDTMLGVESEVV